MFQQSAFLPFVTYGIIAITVLVSLLAFSSRQTMDSLIFYGPAVRRGQWYRLFTSGFIHADYFHLAFNMYAFYGFGTFVEYRFTQLFPGYGHWVYALLYLAALPASDLPSYQRHRDNPYYRSLGASGAVAAVIFAAIVLSPTMPLGIIFIPGVAIPGVIFGVLYIIFSSYLDRKGGGNINHSAHLWGALFGVAFMVVAGYLAGAGVVQDFIYQIQHFRDR